MAGKIGTVDQVKVTVFGPVVNLASRLCDQAGSGQILADRRVIMEIESLAEIDSLGELQLKGFHKPVPAYAVKRLKAPTEAP